MTDPPSAGQIFVNHYKTVRLVLSSSAKGSTTTVVLCRKHPYDEDEGEIRHWDTKLLLRWNMWNERVAP